MSCAEMTSKVGVAHKLSRAVYLAPPYSQSWICPCFVSELIENITERFPDKDTGIIGAFGVFNPSHLPLTSEEAMEKQYGEKEIRELGERYGIGDSPPINCDDLLTEWFDLRVYMILNCRSKSMKEMLPLLAKPDGSLSVAYHNTSKLAQIGLLLPISTADCERHSPLCVELKVV